MTTTSIAAPFRPLHHAPSVAALDHAEHGAALLDEHDTAIEAYAAALADLAAANALMTEAAHRAIVARERLHLARRAVDLHHRSA